MNKDNMSNKIKAIVFTILLYFLSLYFISTNILRIFNNQLTITNINALLTGITLYVITIKALLIIIFGKG